MVMARRAARISRGDIYAAVAGGGAASCRSWSRAMALRPASAL